tara:strand:- start:2027 stop:2281 length:255 start_codon:yes stop_codon:yes gene_type:complete
MTLMLVNTAFLERLRSKSVEKMDRSPKKRGPKAGGPFTETPCDRVALCLQGDSHPIAGMRETKRRGKCPSSMHPISSDTITLKR